MLATPTTSGTRSLVRQRDLLTGRAVAMVVVYVGVRGIGRVVWMNFRHDRHYGESQGRTDRRVSATSA
jgi:hypothetical protein